MSFERESFVPVCTTFIFVCTSKDLEIQRFLIFAHLYIVNLANFLNIEMRMFVLVCISLTFVCTSKGSEIQRFQNFGKTPRGEVGHFKRYEMRPRAFERELYYTYLYLFFLLSFVPQRTQR